MTTTAAPAAHRNEIVLVGRVSGEPQVRTLPSGDEITVWRLVVDRDVVEDGRPGHDTLDCTAWTPRVRRTVASWGEHDVVEIEGALRRRFWRAGGTLASRYEVEAF